MYSINPKIFKAYDIRGIYPSEINEEVIYKLAKGILTFFISKLGVDRPPKLILSYDGRHSSPALFEEVKKALVEGGAEVADIGLSGTPTFYFAVWQFKADAGLQISASHNPKDYNGIKFVIRTPQGLTKIGKGTGMEQVREIVVNESFKTLEKEGTISEKAGVVEEQARNAIELLGQPEIKRLKVVADAANAVGALYLEALFNQLPCELVKMNFEIDGNFPAHQPDPLQFETLKELQKRVIKEKADLGIAPDGDGDRVFFIDEKGEVIPASLTTALIASELLQKYPGEKIVFDLRNTGNVNSAVSKQNGVAVHTKVGHALITETMRQTNALFAGENSGHYFFRQTGNGEDPMPIVLTILAVMTRENKPISQILQGFKVVEESGEINFETENAQTILEIAKKDYQEGELDELDGISIDYPEWRFNIRTSNTEPLLRLNVEAKTRELMEQKRDELITLIKENS